MQKHEQLRYHALIQNLNDAVLVEDENRKIIVTNQAFCDLFNIPDPPEKLLGLDCSSSAEDFKNAFIDPDLFIRSVNQNLEARVKVQNEHLELVDGTCLERDYIPIFDGKKYLGHLWVYKNLTHRYQSERLTHQEYNQFIASASHDLRQPMQAVNLFISALEKTNGEMERLELLKLLKKSSNIVDDLLTDILDISKLKNQKMDTSKEVVCLNDLFENLKLRFLNKANSKNIALTVSENNYYVWSDQFLLERLISNLVDNAIKYTSSGFVSILATVSERDKGILEISVADSGNGLSLEDQQRIFEPFVQIAQPSSEVDHGFGLGLTIVKQISEQLGFSISVQSRLGEGSIFNFHWHFKLQMD